ncbi:MAG: hypothetical protein PHX61_04400 [Alphaproteobacteria bacterium]|nr:hypothetical protein [Alphaproteobacteria bacterium]
MKSIHGLELFNYLSLIADGFTTVRDIVRKRDDAGYVSEKASSIRRALKENFKMNSRVIQSASDEQIVCAMSFAEKLRNESRHDAQIGMAFVAIAIGVAPTLTVTAPVVVGLSAVCGLHTLFSARAKETKAVDMAKRAEDRLRDAVIYGFGGVTYNRSGEMQRWV